MTLGPWCSRFTICNPLSVRLTHMITAQKLSAQCRQTKTQQYDAEAMRYLGYALYPLVIGYAIYALLYQSHKSWYSWVLNSLVGAVYTFGFILMCPQVDLSGFSIALMC